MIEFPAGRFKIRVDVDKGRVGVTVVVGGMNLRATLLPQIAADLAQAIQRAAREAVHGAATAEGSAEGGTSKGSGSSDVPTEGGAHP